MRSRAPAVPVAAVVGLLALAIPRAPGQSSTPRVATAVEPDSIRVGEAFTLGLTVTLDEPGEVRFPAVLELPAELEQRRPVQIRAEEGGTDWRAYYTLSAWTADTHRIPPIEVTLETLEAAPEPLTLTPPEVEVRTVLPAATEDLELRESKGFLRVRTFPWWVLAAVAGLAALAWWMWRRRRPTLAHALPSGPGERALRDLARLRRSWAAGDLGPPQFYDRFEGVVRDYVRATRSWSPGRALLGLGSGTGRLFRTLQRSLIVRFARIDEASDAPEAALDAGEAFVRAEMWEPGAGAGPDPDGGTAPGAQEDGPVPEDARPAAHRAEAGTR